MTFGKWRQQLRLMQAMRLLAERAKVTHAAMEAGYSTPSAFISMFRKAWGTTPVRCFGSAMKDKKTSASRSKVQKKRALENLAGIDFSA
jgi:AraC-like DNA-binding protein